MARSDSSLRVVPSDKEGMILKVIGLLFFAFLLVASVAADDYVVTKGETPTSVATKKKVPLEVLQRANPDLGAKLNPGDHLIIPDRYSVKPGDTLYSLCRQWGVEVSAVLALNDLPAATALKAGQILYVPVPKGAVNTVTPAVVSGFWPVDKTPHNEGDKLKSVSFSTSGEPFRSVSSGTVVYQGEFRGVGRVLMIQRDDKTTFAYGNFEKSAVEFGQAVVRGQILGTTSSRPSQRLTFFVFKQSDSLDGFTVRR